MSGGLHEKHVVATWSLGNQAVETIDFLLEFLSEGKLDRVRVQMLRSFDLFLDLRCRTRLKTPSVCILLEGYIVSLTFLWPVSDIAINMTNCEESLTDYGRLTSSVTCHATA
jgi:hypothetical protein